jgi:uncharacterized protein YbaP (TraB family)
MKLKHLLTTGAASLALFAAPSALAQEAMDADQASAPDETSTSGPALWKVADEDTVIYLFGTVHMLPMEVDWYKDDIAAALTASDTLVTEIPMDMGSEARMQQVAMQKAMLPEGTTLRSLLSEDQVAAYEGALGDLSLPAAAFDRLEPWMVGLTLTTLPLLKEGYSPDSGVEKVLLSKIGEKPQDALETVEFQLGIFDSLPQEKQIDFMMEAVGDIDEAKTMLDKMVAEWIEGDADGLADLMNEGLEDAEIAEALLYSRNANWTDWIDTRLDEPGTVFIAVGAGHLAGAKSVQQMLAERDVPVERVR